MAIQKDFPADNAPDTLVDRAMRKKKRLIPQPAAEDKGAETPRAKMDMRQSRGKPTRPDTKVGARSAGKPSAEMERGQSISQALLRGASMVQQSPVSGTLRGLLGGASVGMDIDVALEGYRQRKKEETAANAAMQMEQPVVQPPTPTNFPPDVATSRPLDGLLSARGRKRKDDRIT